MHSLFENLQEPVGFPNESKAPCKAPFSNFLSNSESAYRTFPSVWNNILILLSFFLSGYPSDHRSEYKHPLFQPLPKVFVYEEEESSLHIKSGLRGSHTKQNR